MSLANDLSVQVIDPVINTSKRFTEWKLNDKNACYRSLKIAGLGFVTNAQNNYNQLAGTMGLLKRLSIYDGRTPLAVLDEANRFLAFKSVMNPNSYNDSILAHKQHNSMGFRLNKKNLSHEFDIHLASTPQQTNTTSATTSKGCLYLSDVFDLVALLPCLHTGVFKNLRVRIEYEQAQEKIIAVDNATATATTDDPVLICERIIDGELYDELTAQMKDLVVPHKAIIHDQFKVLDNSPAGAGESPAKQTTNALLNGFNGKYMNRIVMMNEYSDGAKNLNGNAVIGAGALSALRGWRGNYNLRINGATKLPDGGVGAQDDVDASSHVHARLVDTWGESNCYLGGMFPQVESVDTYMVDGANRQGQIGYFGIAVEERVNNLQVEYKRTSVYDLTAQSHKTGDPMNVHVFGEVKRFLEIAGGEYQVGDV